MNMRTRFILICLTVIMTPVLAQEKAFERVLGGFRFTEGPAVDAAGNLYFTDIPESKIYRYTPGGELSVYLENTEGANGLFFDADGNLVACAGGGRQVVRYDASGSKTVLLDRFEGKKLNSPNDLWIDPDGGIYFTDPRYGNTESMELEGMDVYYFQPGKDKVIRVIDNMTRPNGIIGSHDGKKLYVVDEGEDEFYVFDIKKPGKLENQTRLLYEGADGISIDDAGNIYVTAEKSILKYDPRSGMVQRFELEVRPTNVVWHDGVIWVTTHTGEVWKKVL
jgi:gluconolactonase